MSAKRRVSIVGESFYQGNLDRITGGKTASGHELEVLAFLQPDPSNRHDSNAVAIYVNGSQVGHLDRNAARRYQAVLLNIWSGQRRRVTCKAFVIGGWIRDNGSEGDYGVELVLPSAQAIEDESLRVPAEFPTGKETGEGGNR